jgi:pyridoxamine 5'-phosphate oxidase
MDPIARIKTERQEARNQDDPNADLCFLALSESEKPSVRTLVLRDVSDDGFTLFINTTSPKWSIIQTNNKAEILIWYSKSQTQYRIYGLIEKIPPSILEHSWHRRPPESKYIDYSYESLGSQSSQIKSMDNLTGHIEELKEAHPEEEMVKPESAAGIVLRPEVIEMLDLSTPNRIHDRRRFDLVDGKWQCTQLIP